MQKKYFDGDKYAGKYFYVQICILYIIYFKHIHLLDTIYKHNNKDNLIYELNAVRLKLYIYYTDE